MASFTRMQTDGSLFAPNMLARRPCLPSEPKTSLRVMGTLVTSCKEGWKLPGAKRNFGLKWAHFLVPPPRGSSGSVRAEGAVENLWVSEVGAKTAEAVVRNRVIATDPGESLVGRGLNLAHRLNSISDMYTEVGEDGRQATEYLENVEGVSKGRTAADYNTRAYFYGKSAEILTARKKKGDRVYEDLEELQWVVMEEDNGRTPADYKRRAEIFSKSAEVFGSREKGEERQ